MIRLFEENETEFNHMGLGTLKDATSCKVKETINDTFELTLDYPIKGSNYSKIKIDRIIYAKADPYNNEQPFRIKYVSKPINGTVTVTAVHISYDMNGLPVLPLSGQNLPDVLNILQNGTVKDDGTIEKVCLVDNNFTFVTNVTMSRTFKTTAPYNMRAILMGGDESLVETYKAELKFDGFVTHILNRRGRDRGAKVIYGNNMTDLKHEINTDALYDGVFPFYHSEETSSETETEEGQFKQVYIVGSKPYADTWLSYSKGGEAYHPVDESPVQIASEDSEYYQEVYTWNATYQKYVKRIYNEQVMIIQGMIEPTWVSIDWSRFPIITCKAAKAGYFKSSSDAEWSDLKGVGDTVLEFNILNGIDGIMENVMLNFSEVIPSTVATENEDTVQVIDVRLDDPIIWLNTPDVKNMLHHNVLSLDLTSEFDEEPTKEQLKNKAEEYITENNVGRLIHTTEVSFIDLSKTTEGKNYEKFDHIELGDSVQVIYKDLGVDVTLRVISTEYNVILDRYENLELGEKDETLSTQSIQTGDKVSSLSNDVGYADVTKVNKLIASMVTAEWIEATNAKLSNAQIKQLEVERIDCKGIFEASQFTIDNLVANMLTSTNAKIAQTLEAGNIKVAGDVDIRSGKISISNDEAGTTFYVDRDGNVTANSVKITGGEFEIGNGAFVVTNDGQLTATMAYISGTIDATKGSIGGMIIEENGMHSGDNGRYVYIGTEGIRAGEGEDDGEGHIIYPFEVDTEGNAYANSMVIRGGEIEIKGIDPRTRKSKSFKVDSEGGMQMDAGGIQLGKVERDFECSLYVIYDNVYYKAEYIASIERDEIVNEETQKVMNSIWKFVSIDGTIPEFDGEISLEISETQKPSVYDPIILKKIGTYDPETGDIIPGTEIIPIGSQFIYVSINASSLKEEYNNFSVVDENYMESGYELSIRSGGIKLGYKPIQCGKYKLNIKADAGCYSMDVYDQDEYVTTMYYQGEQEFIDIYPGETLGKWIDPSGRGGFSSTYRDPSSVDETITEENVCFTQFRINIATGMIQPYHEQTSDDMIIEVGVNPNTGKEYSEYAAHRQAIWDTKKTVVVYMQNVSASLEYIGKVYNSDNESFGLWKDTSDYSQLTSNRLILTNAYVDNNVLVKNNKEISPTDVDIYLYPETDGNYGYVKLLGSKNINSFSIVQEENTKSENFVFKVTDDGKLYAEDATIVGDITANSGHIGGFTLENYMLKSGNEDTTNFVLLSPKDLLQGISVGESDLRTDWRIIAGTDFGVTRKGEMYSSKGRIGPLLIDSTGLSVTRTGETSYSSFIGRGEQISVNDMHMSSKTGYYYNITATNLDLIKFDDAILNRVNLPRACKYVDEINSKNEGTATVICERLDMYPSTVTTGSPPYVDTYLHYIRNITNPPSKSDSDYYDPNRHSQMISIEKDILLNMLCVDAASMYEFDSKLASEEIVYGAGTGNFLNKSGVKICCGIYNGGEIDYAHDDHVVETHRRNCHILFATASPIYDGTETTFNRTVSIKIDKYETYPGFQDNQDLVDRINIQNRNGSGKISYFIMYVEIYGTYNE